MKRTAIQNLVRKYFLILAIALAFVGSTASAFASGDLFYDTCEPPRSALAQLSMLSADYRPVGGALSCQQLKSFSDAVAITDVALMPLQVAMLNPQARAAVITAAAELGLTLANPAVLTVTIVGVFGVKVFAFVAKKDLEACAAMAAEDKLKRTLEEELARKYGIRPTNSNFKIKVKRK